MELPESSSFVLGLTEEGEPQRLSEECETSTRYIGFDPDHHRLVEIHRLGSETGLGPQRARSIRERLTLAERLYHPAISLVLESGIDSDEHLYCVTEFIEGEPLIDYLQRNPELPKPLGVHLVLQLSEMVSYLADFPRLLATLSLEDVSVVLTYGRRLTLRLTHLGFDRSDVPVSDAVLGAHWIERVGQLLQHILEGQPLPPKTKLATMSPTGSDLSGPLGTLITRLKSEPGAVAIRELKGLKTALLRAAGLTGDNDHHLRPDFGTILDSSLRPRGPLSLLLEDSSEFEKITQERWRLKHDGHPVDGDSPFVLQARSPRSPSATLGDRGERFDLVFLPPERLVGGTHLPRLNQQMGHSYLKEHPSMVRTRALICDSDFTLIAAEGINGFSLVSLIAERGTLKAHEACIILEEIVRLMAHLEGIELELDHIDPWRLVFHFDADLPAEQIRKLFTQTPVTGWPPMTTKLRPLSTTESMVTPEAGAWRYLHRRLHEKSLPALFAWMLEGHHFEQFLSAGNANEHPLSESSDLADLLEKAGRHLDPADPGHRQRFLELLLEASNEPSSPQDAKDEEEEIESYPTDVEPNAASSRRRGWRMRSPLSAA
ncbi:MAG: hypothetical protein KDN20_24660 [Verrucomicrobiae bacterium]|nr:hypothetical protein [Verrucomicrobiae bacterium]